MHTPTPEYEEDMKGAAGVINGGAGHLNRMGWSSILAVMRYGDRFRRQRRMMWQQFNAQAVLSFRDMQRSQVIQLLGRLLKTPDDFANHIVQYVTNDLSYMEYRSSLRVLACLLRQS